MTKSFDNINVEIDIKKLRRMRLKVYELERKNFRTNRYTIPELKKKIRETIINEYKRNV